MFNQDELLKLMTFARCAVGEYEASMEERELINKIAKLAGLPPEYSPKGNALSYLYAKDFYNPTSEEIEEAIKLADEE